MENRGPFQQRAPALFILPGLVLGLLFAKAMPASSVALLLATGLAILSWILAKREKPKLWLLAFTASTILGFWFYGTVRLPYQPDPDLLSLPPREASLELKIERILEAENRYGQASGVARVAEASKTSRLREGSRIYFRLSSDDNEKVSPIRGLRMRVNGVLHPIPEHGTCDSFASYLKAIGIHYQISQTSGASLSQAASPFHRFCQQANKKFKKLLQLGEPDESKLSQIYIAMLLGEKAELNQDQKDRFKITGTMHLFAISGLHIGVIATVVWQVLLLCRLPSRVRPLIGLPLLYFYVEVTGAAPSAVRAFLMVAFFWLSMALQRQRSPLPALAASAVCVLIIEPLQLWQMGFQLSYLVVISILIFGLPFREQVWPMLKPNKHLPETNWTAYQKSKFWLMDKLFLLFAISLSAWLASAPLSAGFFGFIALYAIFINILLVNLAALVISSGVIALSIGSAGLTALTAFLNHAAWLGISMMDAIVRFNAALPSATIRCPDFPTLISYLGVITYITSIFILGKSNRPLLRFSIPPAIILGVLSLGLSFGE